MLLGELCEEVAKRGELGFGRGSLFEVADDADTNSAGVVEGVTGVGTVELLCPAKRGFDSSVGHSATVADHEVVSNSFPGVAIGVFALEVLLVDGPEASGGGA